MSVQDLPSDLETTPEPDERVIRRLVRALDYSRGFWLGFAKSNTPAQRRRLSALCKDLLEPLKIRVLEIELNEPVTDILPVLRERLAQETAADDEGKATQPKLAIFVHGLERSIPSREAYPPLLSSLNLKRELFRQEVPHPLLLWLPDYALTALARKAPDFWAWRSGLYEFAPEREAAEQSFVTLRNEEIHVTESLSERANHERLLMLKGLLEDYRELGNSPREQSAQERILSEIGRIYETFGEWAEARQAYEESLAISRSLNDELVQGIALNNLGIISQEMGNYIEAKHLYTEFLKIARALNSQFNIAAALHQLGNIAYLQDELKEAKQLYDESLEISKRLGIQYGVSNTLYQLGVIAAKDADLDEARRLYTEGLKISQDINHQLNVAKYLNQLGSLVYAKGDRAEAIRLFREAINIFEKLGSPSVENVRRNLARAEGEDVSDFINPR
jgi:tetratricopeptide (TPR) repeat protein